MNLATYAVTPLPLTEEQFESMSLKQKAHYPFTDDQWNQLSKDQKKRVFFARRKLNKNS